MAKRVFKTTKTLSGKPTKFRSWKEWDVGDIIIAKFIKEGVDNYDNPSYTVGIIECFIKNKLIQKEWVEGTYVSLNSNGQLNKALENMKEGTLIQVTYNGTSTIEKGKFAGKESHGVLVEELEETEDEFDL
jgi:hypothetical protein